MPEYAVKLFVGKLEGAMVLRPQETQETEGRLKGQVDDTPSNLAVGSMIETKGPLHGTAL